MKKFNVKTCPKCGSTDIEWTLPQMWSKWECMECGYRGTVVIEKDYENDRK